MATKTTVNLSPDVRAVLDRSEITSDRVILPAEPRLEKSLYRNVNKVLELAGGQWSRSAQAHIFTSDPRAALGLAMASGEIVDKKKVQQAYYTPDDVAERLVRQHLGDYLKPGMMVLEPSAGGGAFVRAVLAVQPEASIRAIESDPEAIAALKALRGEGLSKERREAGHPYAGMAHVVELDFLKLDPIVAYQAVVMNPPFSNGQDAAHVIHASKFLREGGKLLAIVSPSFLTANASHPRSLRELVEKHGKVLEELPAGTFRESGTNVRTVVILLQKPSV